MQKKKREGKAVILYMDESYFIQHHARDYDLLNVDENGNVIGELPAATGFGLRICIVDGIIRWGWVIL